MNNKETEELIKKCKNDVLFFFKKSGLINYNHDNFLNMKNFQNEYFGNIKNAPSISNFNDKYKVISNSLSDLKNELIKEFHNPRIRFIVNSKFGEKKLIKKCRSKKKRILKKWKKNPGNFKFIPHDYIIRYYYPIRKFNCYDNLLYPEDYFNTRNLKKVTSYMMHTSTFYKLRNLLEKEGKSDQLSIVEIEFI